ncbi:MAG: chloride channel protein [Gammaproteobacteria bacterium]|nr:MAG: chloride channel protein [Gammaproteobacteria bacterium]
MTASTSGLSERLDRLRLLLASSRGQFLLAMLGLISGVLVGMVIILFRLLIEGVQSGILPGGNTEDYESLSWQARILLSGTGGVVLGLLFHFTSPSARRVGVIHVLERLGYHEGHLPFKNMLLQFVGGAIAIISGHSVGREGPSVHLGAATASLLGQKLRMPNNSIRVLVACGAAAAIAASFNTPLAGVIFSMEVIMMEYTIIGFTPVILAAVSATTVNWAVFGKTPAFVVPALELGSYWELPLIVIMGIVIGTLAAMFIAALKWLSVKVKNIPLWIKLPLAGLAVGLCAFFTPEIMGIGYDTVNNALSGELAIQVLLLVLVVKFIATIISIGMGVPAGLIGPTLFIGAITGSLFGLLFALLPGSISQPGLYAMLGMGAMMGATLQAPLAALVTLLELTANQNIIFPGMLAIVSANLTTRELFGYESVYISQMRGIGLDYRDDPVAQSLRRLAVTSVMNSSFALVQPQLNRQQAEAVMVEHPVWLIIKCEAEMLLMPAADLARYLEETHAEKLKQDEDPELIIDLQELPSKRKQLAAVSSQSTLQQGLKILDESDAEALYVIKPLGSSADKIFGVVTRQIIEEAYRHRA